MLIAVGGSAANPPHYGHKLLLEAVVETGKFNQVRWVVSGNRPDKPKMIDAKFRFVMSKMLLGNIGKNGKALVLYEDGHALPTFQAIADLQNCYPEAKIVWYGGADHFVPRKKWGGRCDILGFWDKGEELFKKQKFLIVTRQGVDMSNLQLPQKYQILRVKIPPISSTLIRQKIVRGDRITETSSKIVKYIRENNLYRQKKYFKEEIKYETL